MKLAQIIPGVAGAFYCENCIRDQTLMRELNRRGHDAVMVPLYMPLALDSPGPWRRAPIFFGGIRIYLEQKWPWLRRLPLWVTRPLSSPGLLRMAARLAGMMEPADLGKATVSMLRGESGGESRELDRMAEWLAAEGRPDVVCLSNILLAGLARRLKERLGVPLICLLQDEDRFLDDLPEPYRKAAWDTLRDHVRDMAGFVAVSRYFKSVMERRLALDPSRVHVVYTGVVCSGSPRPAPPAPAIGFMSRICREKGFDELVEAFIEIRRRARIPGLRLRAIGGHTPQDRAFVAGVRRRLESVGAIPDVEIGGEFDATRRAEFLAGVSVLSVPDRRGEASGVCVLEALSAGVPVAQPAHGAYPELIEATGGGLLYPPGDRAGLVSALERLLLNAAEARRMGEAGRAAVCRRFSAAAMADQFVEVCRRISEDTPQSPSHGASCAHSVCRKSS